MNLKILVKAPHSLFLCLIALSLSGCGEDAKSVSYFKEHKEERIQVIKKCIADNDKSQNCRNADQAQREISYKLGSVPHF